MVSQRLALLLDRCRQGHRVIGPSGLVAPTYGRTVPLDREGFGGSEEGEKGAGNSTMKGEGEEGGTTGSEKGAKRFRRGGKGRCIQSFWVGEVTMEKCLSLDEPSFVPGLGIINKNAQF